MSIKSSDTSKSDTSNRIEIMNEIKSLAAKCGMNLSDLVRNLNEKHNRSDTKQNLHRKLSKETIKYREILEIVDLLGYEIKFVPKKEEKDDKEKLEMLFETISLYFDKDKK